MVSVLERAMMVGMEASKTRESYGGGDGSGRFGYCGVNEAAAAEAVTR